MALGRRLGRCLGRRPGRGVEERVEGEGLVDQRDPGGAGPGADGGVGVSGDQDHGHAGIEVVEPGADFQAVEPRQDVVEEDEGRARPGKAASSSGPSAKVSTRRPSLSRRKRVEWRTAASSSTT